MHKRGYAHSVEVWKDKQLVGGLYGLESGKIFSGESMFSFEKDASKFALICMVKHLQKRNFLVIDCQQKTEHISLLGGREIAYDAYFSIIRENIFNETDVNPWSSLN